MRKKITYTNEPLQMGERVKDFLPPPSKLVLREGTGTDWSKLRKKSAKAIRAGIKADPDAHPINAAFWRGAKVVRPSRTGR